MLHLCLYYRPHLWEAAGCDVWCDGSIQLFYCLLGQQVIVTIIAVVLVKRNGVKFYLLVLLTSHLLQL